MKSARRTDDPLSIRSACLLFTVFFFFNDPATTEIYTLSLHDALPICIPIITASERELREIKRCWMIIGMRSGGNGRIPKWTIYSENVPDHKSRRASPARTSARGKKLFDRIFNGLRIPLQIAHHGIADSLLGIEHQSSGQHLHFPCSRDGG